MQLSLPTMQHWTHNDALDPQCSTESTLLLFWPIMQHWTNNATILTHNATLNPECHYIDPQCHWWPPVPLMTPVSVSCRYCVSPPPVCGWSRSTSTAPGQSQATASGLQGHAGEDHVWQHGLHQCLRASAWQQVSRWDYLSVSIVVLCLWKMSPSKTHNRGQVELLPWLQLLVGLSRGVYWL